VGGDRLRDVAGRDRKEGGRIADFHTIIGDAECLGTGGTNQIEGGLDLVIAAEIGLPPDDRGALEEVAGAAGRPGIANIVVPGEDQNTRGAQYL
jgi:hypothetical protein